ncbi:hypothetical protein GCM10011575_33980 [Microlunatus endophyticus]|uniref:Carbohydrate ABC transporter substrate-binding protein, CUT1 family n=1 Tax=Microlunatus endophyticus TaxID=1716077 RepID=A0A917SDN1_9ACTN|nr:extracellular solute-binding protein [Microlunatus endophyticus]GGL72912.1 hypothetical protein GCM10011575_33980 [Microlunatus endophyticus]
MTHRRAYSAALAVLASAAIALSLIGCSSDNSSGSGGTTTLTYFAWDTKPLMQPLMDEFEKENPTIKIDYSFAPPQEQYNATLQKRILSGTAADVYMIDGENRTALIDNHDVTDLTDKPFMKNIQNGGHGNGYDANGHVYGMNVSSWGNGLVINMKLAKEAGMTEPPKTWAELLQLCQKFKDMGVTPVEEALNGNVSPILAALVGAEFAQEGGDPDAAIFSGKSTFAAQWTKPLQTYNELYQHGYATKASVSIDPSEMVNEFANGKVAMIVTGPEQVAPIHAAAPDLKFEYMAVPGPDGGQFYAGSASASYAINPKAKEPDAAAKWLAFLSSAEGAKMYNKQLNAITTTTNFKPTVDPSIQTMADGIRAGHIYWPVIGWKRDQQALSNTLVAEQQQLALGQLSPAQVAAGLDAKLKQLG